MILVIVSIRDRAADAFNRPFFVPSRGLAIRSFADEVNRQAQDNQMYSHPEDFDLYELGTFDENTGQFSQPSQPLMIAVGKDVKQ